MKVYTNYAAFATNYPVHHCKDARNSRGAVDTLMHIQASGGACCGVSYTETITLSFATQPDSDNTHDWIVNQECDVMSNISVTNATDVKVIVNQEQCDLTPDITLLLLCTNTPFCLRFQCSRSTLAPDTMCNITVSYTGTLYDGYLHEQLQKLAWETSTHKYHSGVVQRL